MQDASEFEEERTAVIPRESMQDVVSGPVTARARTLELRSPSRTVAAMERLRAHLRAEGLVLCRAPDTGFALADEREDAVLAALAHAGAM